MKRCVFGCLLLALCLVFSACSQQPAAGTAPKPCADVAAAVQAGQPFEELTALSGNQILKYFDLDESLLSDMAVEMDASRATAEMIAVLAAVDQASLKQAQDALAAYRDVTLEQYRDYRPDEVPKLEGAVLKTKGLQTVLIVSKDAQAAEKSLDAAW